uniref:Hand bHLH transcription factor n=1 Tax=Clytia hemisphaerica TaxID=252671 RepID=A0A0A8P4P1_9CNID|nr:Hand bHLH transcription factor [Clytia hemisphaerica]
MMNLPQIKVEHNELSSYNFTSSSCNYESAESAYNSSPEASITPSTNFQHQPYSTIFQFEEQSCYNGSSQISTQAADLDYSYFNGANDFINSYEQYQTATPYSQYVNPSTKSTAPYTSRSVHTRKHKRFHNNQYPYLPTYSKNTRRSETINIAFAAVRGCIPNVSEDTKLSKIQTLRLAISYMRFLMSCLGDYRFMMLMNDKERELYKEFFEEDKKVKESEDLDDKEDNKDLECLNDEPSSDKVDDKDRLKGRSRWPQVLWQTTLKT